MGDVFITLLGLAVVCGLPALVLLAARDRLRRKKDGVPTSQNRAAAASVEPPFVLDYSKLDLSRPASGKYRMTYRDAKGDVSVRTIDLKRVDRFENKIEFYAYCHQRKALRTFRADRVMRLEDLNSGMVFDEDIEVYFAGKLLRVGA